jgi:hypothetical protein
MICAVCASEGVKIRPAPTLGRIVCRGVFACNRTHTRGMMFEYRPPELNHAKNSSDGVAGDCQSAVRRPVA